MLARPPLGIPTRERGNEGKPHLHGAFAARARLLPGGGGVGCVGVAPSRRWLFESGVAWCVCAILFVAASAYGAGARGQFGLNLIRL